MALLFRTVTADPTDVVPTTVRPHTIRLRQWATPKAYDGVTSSAAMSQTGRHMSQTDKVPYFKSWQDPTAAAGCNDVGAALSAMNTIE